MIISGNVTTAEGLAADFVRIFRWPNRSYLGTAVPDTNGDWSYGIATTDDYGITYIADGCQPVTHGPYHIEVTDIAARYVRFFIKQAHDSDRQPIITEVWLTDEAGGQVLSKTESVTASSEYGAPASSYGAIKIIDGDPSIITAADQSLAQNRWMAGGKLDEWVSVDLGETKSFRYAHVLGVSYAASNNVTRCPLDWSIEVSDDGVSWTPVYSNTAEHPWNGDEIRTFDLTAA